MVSGWGRLRVSIPLFLNLKQVTTKQMKKPVTPEQKPPIPDEWYLVKTPNTESGWAVAKYDSNYQCWIAEGLTLPIEVGSYIPEPLNEIE